MEHAPDEQKRMPPKCLNLVLPLVDIQLRKAKPKDKPYKLADGGGLYLEVMPSGSKLWPMKFKQTTGNERRLAFGAYLEVSLLEARKRRAAAREQLAGGVDPAQAKRIEKQNKAKANAKTFEAVAPGWHANRRRRLAIFTPAYLHLRCSNVNLLATVTRFVQLSLMRQNP
ncbi:MAG: intC [Herminiimonas sp.]|nr:intC [Herminiimonas sp.]